MTTTGNTVTHIYSTPGQVLPRVTVTNTDGDTGSTQIALVVAPSVFSVALTFSPASPDSGTLVTFTAQVNPQTTVVSDYMWDFGDGTAVVTTSSNTTTHTFSSAAGLCSPTTFIVKVTATKANRWHQHVHRDLRHRPGHSRDGRPCRFGRKGDVR